MGIPGDNSTDEIIVRLDPLIADIVDAFLEHRREDVTAIWDALKTSDLEAVDHIGHDLEGTAGAFGFSDMAIFGHSLQQAARESSHDQIKRLGEELTDYLDRLKIVYEQS